MVIMNVLWLIFFGWTPALMFIIVGSVCYISIIGIPLGKACFKAAELTLTPFGKEIIYPHKKPINGLANFIWIVFAGFWLALIFALLGVAMCCTIVGIPFGLQYFKFATLAFKPFGAKVITK